MQITLGVFDPFATPWLDEFYPLDLPEDWRLDYLANVYQACLVPVSRNASPCGVCPPHLDGFLWIGPESSLPAYDAPESVGDTWKAVLVAPDAGGMADGRQAFGRPSIEAVPWGAGYRAALGEGLELVLLRVPAPVDLRAVRGSVERLVREAGGTVRLYLMIDTPPSDLERIRVMLELMGY